MREALEIAAAGERVRSPHSDLEPGIALCCPLCKRGLTEERRCDRCGFVLKERDGIVFAIAPDRLAHYTNFIADYECIRAAEGRSSRDKKYYLALPYHDETGHNSGQWKIRARSFDYLVHRILKPTGSGESVLDLGAGNCWLSFQLARRGYRSVAVDLLVNREDGLGAATYYREDLGSNIPCFQAEVNCLPFQDEQFDIAVFNASFHYSEDYESTLREVLRCVKSDGMVVICDTPWYSREQSGDQMVEERRADFLNRFGTASDSMKSQEFLTDERLRNLAERLSIRWTVHNPWYGWRWFLRPWLARLRRRREPSRFRIYVARRDVS